MKGREVKLNWVDDFIKTIRPYVKVRREDHLLILVPNEAYKINPTAERILSFLLRGGSIRTVERRLGSCPERLGEIHNFFCDLTALMKGCLHEGERRRAVVEQPFSLPFNTLPILSELALTYRCNLECKFCYANCNCSRGDAQELSTREVRKVLRVISRDAKVPSVSFTGGEPLLRRDLIELVRYASRALRVNLITNGTLVTSHIARGLSHSGLKSAQVSLEGPSPEIHDALTQVEGSFEKTLAGIEHLRSAGIRVHTNTTVNRINVGSLFGLLGLVERLRLERLSMNLVIPSGAAGFNDEELAVTYSEIAPILTGLKLEAQRLGIKFLWYSPTPMCIFNPIAEGLGNKSCAACDGLLSVGPDGGVLPCSSYPESVGNLLEESFRRVWDSPRARFFREKRFAPQECLGCEKLEICSGACPLYWEKRGTRELADVKARVKKVVENANICQA